MKILVIKPSSLGDVIHALRVISVLRKTTSDFVLHWVIRKGLEGIISASGIVDRYFLFERGGGLLKYLNLGKKLRAEKYDCIIDMQGLFRSSILGLLTGCSTRYGRADGREFSTLFYKCLGPKKRNQEIHAIERLIPFIEPFAEHPAGDRLTLDFPHSVPKVDQSEQRDTTRPRVILFPESRRKEKVWPHFGELAIMIIESQIAEVIVCGTFADQQYAGVTDLRGTLDLAELVHVAKGGSLIVSNDSAPLHLASALNRPAIGLFGPTNPLRYGPYPRGESHGLTLSSSSGKIEEIGIEQVFLKVREMI